MKVLIILCLLIPSLAVLADSSKLATLKVAFDNAEQACKDAGAEANRQKGVIEASRDAEELKRLRCKERDDALSAYNAELKANSIPKELEGFYYRVELLRFDLHNKKIQLNTINTKLKGPSFGLLEKQKLDSDKIYYERQVKDAQTAYDSKKAQYDSAVKTYHLNNPKISATPAGPPIPKLSEEEKNYLPESCVWSNDIPKRLVFGPGCKDTNLRICVGYVICDQKDPAGKFVRVSTCSAKNCAEGNEAAVACTKESGYGSRKPSEDASISLGASVQSIMLKTETVPE